MDPLVLIHKYCDGNEDLEKILVKHSSDVARRVIKISNAHPEFQIDLDFIYEAAMLHDIGVVRVNAPSVHCFGTEPYICHGILGAEILLNENLPRHARVAQRHTGTGLTKEAIQAQSLPLPAIDLVPETIEEEIICYADKFYSKSHPEKEKTLEQAMRSLSKFGEESVQKFKEWICRFEHIV